MSQRYTLPVTYYTMFRLLCLVSLATYVLSAPGHTSHTQHQVNIDYMKGLFYEDLAKRYMVLVMPDGCYFWHMTHQEAEVGLSPSGIRHIENEFVTDLKNGVSLTRIHRSNFNHMAGTIVFHCRDVDSYLIHRDHFDHLLSTDLSSVNLEGTLAPNITIIHAISSK